MILTFDKWSNLQAKKHPQFKYWDNTLHLELLLLEYVKSLRTGDFQLYVKTIQKIAPWMFSLDHHNYARYLPVHIRDMMTLEKVHPDLYKEFNKKKFCSVELH